VQVRRALGLLPRALGDLVGVKGVLVRDLGDGLFGLDHLPAVDGAEWLRGRPLIRSAPVMQGAALAHGSSLSTFERVQFCGITPSGALTGRFAADPSTVPSGSGITASSTSSCLTPDAHEPKHRPLLRAEGRGAAPPFAGAEAVDLLVSGPHPRGHREPRPEHGPAIARHLRRAAGQTTKAAGKSSFSRLGSV
jgi:hypothetical protein